MSLKDYQNYGGKHNAVMTSINYFLDINLARQESIVRVSEAI